MRHSEIGDRLQTLSAPVRLSLACISSSRVRIRTGDSTARASRRAAPPAAAFRGDYVEEAKRCCGTGAGSVVLDRVERGAEATDPEGAAAAVRLVRHRLGNYNGLGKPDLHALFYALAAEAQPGDMRATELYLHTISLPAKWNA